MVAWEITIDDVDHVFCTHGIIKTEEEVETISDELDHDAIIDRLLTYTDMETQFNSMMEDIESQLIELNHLPKDVVRKFEVAE